MAVTDAYATAAEYRARVGKADTAEDAVILEQLTAVSRYIDQKTGRHFTKDAAVTTRLYDGNGGEKLRLPDDIATTTGLIVKVDTDSDYAFTLPAETLVLNTHYFLDPVRAGFGSEPVPWGRLSVKSGNGVFSVWPEQKQAIEITAVFGWPAVPAAIKEATCALTRQLRDLQHAGMTLTLENLDAQIRVSPDASRIIDDMVRRYKRTDQTGWFV